MLVTLLLRAINTRDYAQSFNLVCEIQNKMEGKSCAGVAKLKMPRPDGNYYLFATDATEGNIYIPFHWTDPGRKPSLSDGIRVVRKKFGYYDYP